MSVFLFLHLTTHLPRWLFSPRQIRFFGNFVTQFFFWWRNVRKLPFPEALLVLSGCQEECRPRNDNMKMIWHHSNSASNLPPALDWGIGTVSVLRRAGRKPSWRRTCRSTRCSSARHRSSHTWARRWWCWYYEAKEHIPRRRAVPIILKWLWKSCLFSPLDLFISSQFLNHSQTQLGKYWEQRIHK